MTEETYCSMYDEDVCTKCRLVNYEVDKDNTWRCKEYFNEPNCATYKKNDGNDDSIKCVSCVSGYFLTKDFKCSKCAEGCSNCAGTAECKTFTYCGQDEQCTLCKDITTCELCDRNMNYDVDDNGKCEPVYCASRDGKNVCTMCVTQQGEEFHNHREKCILPDSDGNCPIPQGAPMCFLLLGLLLLALL